jgi:hypothetical protein
VQDAAATGTGMATGTETTTGTGGTDALPPAQVDAAAPRVDAAEDAAAAPRDVAASSDVAPGSAGQAHPMTTFFLTSARATGGANFGGLAGADAYCEEKARSVGVGGRGWKAFLSTSQENARARIGRGPWHNSKGAMIAPSVDALFANGIMNLHSVILTEKGEALDNTKEWHVPTGSTVAGALDSTGTCNDWTSTTGRVMVGHPNRTVQNGIRGWSSAHDFDCSLLRPGEPIKPGWQGILCFATMGPGA